jgi:hypothetical protein
MDAHDCSTAAMLIGTNGTTAVGLKVLNTSHTTGGVTGVFANIQSINATTNKGVYGVAGAGSSYSIGLDGAIGVGSGIVSSQYVAGVRGNILTNAHVTGYGGRFRVEQRTNITWTKDMVGVYGEAFENVASNASTGKVIGGQFKTGVSGAAFTPINKHMAINVPLTGNDGVVVFGADLSVSDSMLQVTGDTEVIGALNGLILTDRTDGVRYRFWLNNGALQTEVVA